MCYFNFTLDNDLITIADATDFAHAREYSKTKVVKMVIYGEITHTRLYIIYTYISEFLKHGLNWLNNG